MLHTRPVCIYVCMFVCTFSGGLGGRWVGAESQDDRFTVLRAVEISPLCISLLPLQLTMSPSLAPSPSTTFPYVSPFSTLICTLPLFSVFLLSCKSVVSCFCHFFFTLHCVLFFSFHSWLFVSPFALLISPNLAPCVCSPSLSSPLLCTVDHSSAWPLVF